MLWLLALGTFALWFVAAVANFGGDLIDLLLVVPAAMLILQLLPRRKAAESGDSAEPTPLLTLAPAADEGENASVDNLRRAA